MVHESTLVTVDRSNHGLYANSRVRERVLNAAIVQADISTSFEEYLEIFNNFYADGVVATSDTDPEPVRGKARLRSVLLNFLIPLHVMAEVGGLSVSIREAAIPGDTPDETHSAWTLELVGASGKTCTLTWRTLRKWDGAHVVYEHHYDHKQVGGPLTSDDLGFDAAEADGGLRLPS
jgi:DMSO/TMAO reductase YedYZ molybdopterin-dependent catalytic subunit